MQQETSKIAYAQQEANGDNERVRELVLDAIKLFGVGTRETVSMITGLSEEQAGKRFNELQKRGLIYKTDIAKLSRSTKSLQYVWAISGVNAYGLLLQDIREILG